MISKLSLSEVEFPNHFLEYSENECPLFWKYQIAGLKNLPEQVEIIRNEIYQSGCVIISSLNLLKFNINLKKKFFLGYVHK